MTTIIRYICDDCGRTQERTAKNTTDTCGRPTGWGVQRRFYQATILRCPSCQQTHEYQQMISAGP